MGIPYYPPKTCKEGSFELGVSLSTFMKLVVAGEIEISYRGGKFPNINNDTLNVYKKNMVVEKKDITSILEKKYMNIKKKKYCVILS